MKTPRVTIVIPAYNAAATLETSVRSAQAQTLDDLQIIIVDDASKDSTLDVALSLSDADPRILVIGQKTNGGPAAARNRALTSATGEWIAVLDADDSMAPERLAKMVEVAEQRQADLIADNLMMTPADAPENARPLLGPSQESLWTDPLTPLAYLQSNRFSTSGPKLGYLKPLIRTHKIKELGVAYDERLRIGEDFHFCLDLLLRGATYHLTPLAMYQYTTNQAGSISFRFNTDVLTALNLANAEIIASLDKETPEPLRQELARRGVEIQQALLHQTFVDSAKSKDYAGALKTAGTNPQIWSAIAQSVFEGVRRRLGALLSTPKT